MKISLATTEPKSTRADVLSLAVHEEELDQYQPRSARLKALDSALGGVLSSALKADEFSGKPEQMLTLHTHGKLAAERLVLLGAGNRKEGAIDRMRAAAARAAKIMPKGAGGKAALSLPEWDEPEDLVRAAAEGAGLGAYKFERYLAEKKKPITELQLLVGAKNAALARALEEGRLLAESVNFARDMVNEPAITMTPVALADCARQVAREAGLTAKILGPREIARLRMGMFLGVAQGSIQEPRLIHLEYKPAGKAKGDSLAFVGKAITFDSGGLSIKPANSMEDMKTDMAGAAAVLGAMRVIGAMKPPFAVHAFIGTCENMPSGTAYRPGDILRSRLGKTVEVKNTDAEGRLVLGDVLTWAVEHGPAGIVDLATLTGACVVALGPYTTGAWGNDDSFTAEVVEAGNAVGEDTWQMPMVEALLETIKSPVADLKNIGDRWGGAITAALFLREFVGKTPWVHLDIAGPSSLDKDKGYHPKGGTGVGVRTLVELVRRRASKGR